MFHPSSERPLPTEEGLRGLCASLNSAMLQIDEIPEGLAQAAVLLYVDADGSLQVAVCMRSIETGAVAVFRHRGAIKQGRVAAAMEAALSFGESMGFLFDDDLVKQGGSQGRALAVKHWQALILGGHVEIPSVAADEPLDLLDAEEGADLLLDPLQEPVDSPARPLQPLPAKVASAPEEATDAPVGVSELGRIPLVKRREIAEKPSILMRLLGHF